MRPPVEESIYAVPIRAAPKLERAVVASALRTPNPTDPAAILSVLDWAAFDPTALFEAIRERGPAADAEQTIWAFERALRVARMDAAFIEHLVIASVCVLALDRDETPRMILEQLFRRSVSDGDWRENYAVFAF